MTFEFKKCLIEGLYEVQPELHGDDNCNLVEVYVEKGFKEAGLMLDFVQDDQAQFSKNYLYGLRFQKKHSQGKLIRVIFGKIYYVVVDLRNESPTFGKYYGVILDGKLQNQFYIEAGFAHGFVVLSDKAVVEQKNSDFYYAEEEDGIYYMDSSISIDWKDIAKCNLFDLSDKDKSRKRFDYSTKYFDIQGRWIGE